MTRKNRIGRGLALIGCCATATLAWAEPPQEAQDPAPAGNEMRQAPRERLRPEVRERMRARNARLRELVAAMNAAEGDAKVEAIAAVVNELVEQRHVGRGQAAERRKRRQEGARPSP